MSTFCLIIIAQYFLCLQSPEHAKVITGLSILVAGVYALVKLGEWAQDFNHKTALKKKLYEKLSKEIDDNYKEKQGTNTEIKEV